MMLAALLATLVPAQDHSGHAMPGMTMPMPATPAARPRVRKRPAAKPTTPKPAAPRPAAPKPAAPVDHSGMDHSQTDHSTMDHSAMAGMDHTAPAAADPAPADPHAGHVMTAPAIVAPETAPLGTDLPPGDAPAPPVPTATWADRVWNPAAMARARATMMHDEGGAQTFAQVMLDIAELRVRDGGTGYGWEGEGWFGGDIHRLVVKSEGEGGDRVDAAEVQALYSRAIGPYFNLQGGVRHDIRPTPTRTFAVLGVEGLAPYWFEVEAAAFVSTKGELLARIEGYYDQRLTQRWIAQPRAELNLSAQDIRDTGTGSGITAAELGLRLRYEITREFAPYVGVSWERTFGDTARVARARGDDSGGASIVAGVRAWF